VSEGNDTVSAPRRLRLLSDLRVIEAGDSIAVAAAGALLHRLGASVERIEFPRAESGDRRKGLPGAHEEMVRTLLSRGKSPLESLRQNGHWEQRLKEIAGRNADIVVSDVSGFAPEGTASVADGYVESVHRWNRGSWITISSFGLSNGDFGGFQGSELTYLASGGMLWHTRDGRRHPLAPGGFQASYAVGHVAALAGLAGVSAGVAGVAGGRHYDVSAQEAVIALASFLECAHALLECPGAPGAGRYVEPRGTYPCLDGQVFIMALQDHHWRGVVKAMGEPAWAKGFLVAGDRERRGEELRGEFSLWTGRQRKSQCAELLQACGVPATAVNVPEELAEDEETAANFEGVDVLGRRGNVPGLPIREVHGSDGCPASEEAVDHVGSRLRPAGIAGLRVLDLTHVLAGPLATSWLGALGADVVKVEGPERPDSYRFAGSPIDGVAGLERGAYYAALNHSKRNVAIDLDKPDGQQSLRDLFGWAEVVVENQSKARAERLGLSAPNVWRSNPDAMFISSSGFGREGRLSSYRVYGKNIHAHAGLMACTLDEDGQPHDVGTTLADPLTAVWIAALVLAHAVGGGGRGAGLDISMSLVLQYQLSEYFVLARDEWPADRGVCVRCEGTDRWLAIGPGSVEAVLGGLDPQTRERVEAGEESLPGWDRDESFMRLGSAGEAVAPVWSAMDLAQSGHLARRDFFRPVRHPVWGSRRLISLPWREVGSEGWDLTRPRRLGEDTEPVLAAAQAIHDDGAHRDREAVRYPRPPDTKDRRGGDEQ
jgi:crotonobetainyl-CoA:carnitine CoA-transferase CaiB-like acyl-CoA transferase